MIGNVTLIQLLLLGLLPLFLFAWLGVVGVLAIKRRWVWAAVLASPAVFFPLWLAVVVYHPFGPVGRLRVLARAEAPGGTRLVLTQSRNEDWREPYTIHCWLKPPNRPWGCIPIDFESDWWRSGEIRMDGSHAQIFNGRQLELDLFLKDHTYRLAEDEEPNEPVWVEAGWEPRDGADYRDVLDRAFGRKYEPPKKISEKMNDRVTTTTENSPDRKQR